MRAVAMVTDDDWRADLSFSLQPFLAALSHPARRAMCPLYAASLIGLPRRLDDRRVISSIIRVVKSGGRLTDAPRAAKGGWVGIGEIVECTLPWLARFRRLAIRYERSTDIQLAVTTLACGLAEIISTHSSI